MKYESCYYFHAVQRSFVLHFPDTYDAGKRQMRDFDGTLIRSGGKVWHWVEPFRDGAILGLYSDTTLVARMWRAPKPNGVRIYGWQHPGVRAGGLPASTARHVKSLTPATGFNKDIDGVDVFGRSVRPDTDCPRFEAEIEIGYAEALACAKEDSTGILPPKAGLWFESRDLGQRWIRVLKQSDDQWAYFGVPTMVTDEALLRDLARHGESPNHLTMKLVRQTSTRGYCLDALGGVVLRYEAIPLSEVPRLS